MAPLAVIELVDRDEKAKGLDSGPVQKKKEIDENKSDEKVADAPKESIEQTAKEDVSEKELKENEEIAKKLEEKKDK